jgi:hypothetical protein
VEEGEVKDGGDDEAAAPPKAEGKGRKAAAPRATNKSSAGVAGNDGQESLAVMHSLTDTHMHTH